LLENRISEDIPEELVKDQIREGIEQHRHLQRAQTIKEPRHNARLTALRSSI